MAKGGTGWEGGSGVEIVVYKTIKSSEEMLLEHGTRGIITTATAAAAAVAFVSDGQEMVSSQ